MKPEKPSFLRTLAVIGSVVLARVLVEVARLMAGLVPPTVVPSPITWPEFFSQAAGRTIVDSILATAIGATFIHRGRVTMGVLLMIGVYVFLGVAVG